MVHKLKIGRIAALPLPQSSRKPEMHDCHADEPCTTIWNMHYMLQKSHDNNCNKRIQNPACLQRMAKTLWMFYFAQIVLSRSLYTVQCMCAGYVSPLWCFSTLSMNLFFLASLVAGSFQSACEQMCAALLIKIWVTPPTCRGPLSVPESNSHLVLL